MSVIQQNSLNIRREKKEDEDYSTTVEKNKNIYMKRRIKKIKQKS
jgi:hypothetical protein